MGTQLEGWSLYNTEPYGTYATRQEIVLQEFNPQNIPTVLCYIKLIASSYLFSCTLISPMTKYMSAPWELLF